MVEVEKPDDKLATMVFKQGLYVHSLPSQKLNKRKYNNLTLVKCFDIVNDLTRTIKPRRQLLIRTIPKRLIE